MIIYNNKYQRGGGLLNWMIDKLPVELHLPGYNYCGPGTKLKKRLKRGDKPINDLDSLCLQHDLAYESKDSKKRNEADKKLANGAWEIFKSNNSGLSERAFSYLVTTLLNAKSKFGGNLKVKNKHRLQKIKRKKK